MIQSIFGDSDSDDELQDTELLARISGGDLVAIETKYHFKCLSAYKSKYRSVQQP